MSTLVCVPITVDDLAPALADAQLARDGGADLVEYRIDECFSGTDDPDEERLILQLVADSPLPCIVTCRPTFEGGAYDGPEDARVSLFEKLGTAEHPPAYIDVELQAYTRSANFRQKVNLAVQHPKQQRSVRTRLILSIHDFDGRPSDLTRRLADAWAEPAASVVKLAYRARSLRDNLELFELLREGPKPMIALGMGEFGLMSRVLAPKFGGFLTFASLRDSTATAPGQPTLSDLLGMYRFRSIGPETLVYGVIGWPVGHSMSPLIHNAGFEAVGHDGVYLPLPIAAGANDADNATSLKGTLGALLDDRRLGLAGASVTLPFKKVMRDLAPVEGWQEDDEVTALGAANTLARDEARFCLRNTDHTGLIAPLETTLGSLDGRAIAVVGSGGVARTAAIALARCGARVTVYARTHRRAVEIAATHASINAAPLGDLQGSSADAYINCTPIGMDGGPEPGGTPVPIDAIERSPTETVFFDTVYNPIDTPLLEAAGERGRRVIDGVQMFVKQAAGQFRRWTGKGAPVELFDRLVRERLGG
ncbi:MAG: type I 3-dehydroquinate dehydratase [Planctomycetota bacterium]